MGEYSFDIVSNFNHQELINALDQTRREIAIRYDFKDSKTKIDLLEDKIVVLTESPMRLQAVESLIIAKASKRGLATKIFDIQPHEQAGGGLLRQEIFLRKELNQETAKQILKRIKEKFKKVKVAIQGDSLRVSDKSKDSLQEIMAFVRSFEDIPYPLQFTNYR